MAGDATIASMGVQATATPRREVAAAFALLSALVLALPGCAGLEAARLYARGTRALDSGDVARAVADLEAAAALRPDRSEIRNHLGLAYRAAGRPEDAGRAFRDALRLDCGNRAARHNLAVLERTPNPGVP